VDCYAHFVTSTGKSVVMAFDTVETLRGAYLLVTLAQWMKALPSTLFILSGRPMPDHNADDDPIKAEFAGPYQGLPVEVINLREFAYQDALRYLDSSGVRRNLTDEEKEKLVYLTRGHPLWLASAISYVHQRNMPEESSPPVGEISRLMPYGEPLSREGRVLQEEFRRRLISPYRETDFWHEAVKLLAVLRQAVNSDVWRQIMAGRDLPRDAPTIEQAWQRLMEQPWIRPRANGRYVTLHDAMAEELALRIMPVHDQGRQWRRDQWQRAVGIYGQMVGELGPRLEAEQAALDDQLLRLDEITREDGENRIPSAEETSFIEAVTRFDAQKHELNQFRAARLFYQLLSDFERGCQLFLRLFEEAEKRLDFYAEELLALEIHRFLPSGFQRYALGDVVSQVIQEFSQWLPSERPELYRQIGLIMAEYLILVERPQAALDLLGDLPVRDASGIEAYRANLLHGNACMRIPDRVKEGERYFQDALAEARNLPADSRQKMIAQAQKELGFYYRNEGKWGQADDAYRHARDAISEALEVRDSDEDREEMASIHTNWAYLKGLTGNYRDGNNLAESAIAVRHRLNKNYDEGISWSVCGEVRRYERRFDRAWEAYSTAEEIFHGERSWTWLGVIYQEQAICLFQAMQDEINLVPGKDPLERAKHLITLALDICRDQAVRNYPSALNRAGRIFGWDDPEVGLAYLSEGIDWARRLSDGWFWFANLVEFIELCYQSWVRSGGPGYIDRINEREPEIRQIMETYDFPDLQGRWNLVQGHLAVRRWEETLDERHLDSALEKYRDGFALIAQAYVGSSGASALPGEFRTFAELFFRLPQTVRSRWQRELRRAWHRLPEESTMLLARLEELH
jgi:tetratricopeptide (TPR) repeat protein